MKTFKQFQVELNEIRGITSLTKNLSRAVRSGPAFKASGVTGHTTRMHHGTASNVANKIRARGFKSATTCVIRPEDLKFYKDTGRKLPYHEKGRAFVTSDPKRAQFYANRAAGRNRGLFGRNKPEVMSVDVPTSGLRRGVKDIEYTVKANKIQPRKKKDNYIA